MASRFRTDLHHAVRALAATPGALRVAANVALRHE